MSRILGDVFQILSGNVGLGTTLPRQKLDIQDGNAYISGKIGIATTEPVYTLDVVGDINFTGGLYQGGLLFSGGGGSGGSLWSSNGAKIYYNTGNVGIGSTNPMYKLHVIGDTLITGPLTVNDYITAPSFLGTATQVSQDLTRGLYLIGDNYNGSVATTWAVDADSTNTPNKVVVRDASGNFKASLITANLNGTATQVSQDLTRGSYLIGNNYNGSVATTWAVDADSTNTPNKVVVRDASGNFKASLITANLNGTATQVSQDLTRGSYLIGDNYNGSVATTWAVDADSTNTPNKVVVRDAAGNFKASLITANLNGTATQVSQDLMRGSYLIGDNYNGSIATTWAVDADSAAVANKVVVRDTFGNIYAANVGVGTTAALYAVDVMGDVNFTGILRQSGTPYISSQWTTNGTNIYYSSGNVGIGTDQPQSDLHVIGDIRASQTIYASNLQILGSFNILDTTTSNTQQLVIINNGSGTALIAKQTGVNYVAQFYHDDTEVFTIADGGLIGINTSTPRAPLDIIGDTILTGSIGFGTTQPLARLYLRHFDAGTDDILRVDNTNTNTTSLMVNHNGNVGIGTSGPLYPFHVVGSSYFNGSITTNNNNINAGSGTVTAATFAGTATQVSQDLIRGTYLIGDNYNGSIATSWAVDADRAAVANKIVARDAFGNIYAGNVGVGTTSALYTVDVVGDVNFTGDLYQNGVLFSGGGGGSSQWTTNGSNIYYSSGNVGIGVTDPKVEFDVNGTIQTSNIRVLGRLTFGPDDHINNDIQVAPIRKIFYTDTDLQNEFTLIKSGIYGGAASNIQVFVGKNLLSYYDNDINDYNLSISYTASNTIYKVILSEPVDYASIVDIIIWPSILPLSQPHGNLQQTIIQNIIWTENNGDIYYNSGNVGIGTTDTSLGKLVVAGNIVPSACNVYDLGTSNLRWRDLYLSGNTIDLGGTRITQDIETGGIRILNDIGTDVDVKGANIYATTGVGIGTNVARKALDVQGGDVIVSGNVGIGTTMPLYALDANGDINFTGILRQSGTPYISSQWTTNSANLYYTTGSVGIGTTTPRSTLDVQGGNAIVSGNVGIGTTMPLYALDANGDINFTGILRQSGTPYISSQWTTNSANLYYTTGSVGIGTTTPRSTLDVEGGNAIVSGNVGIGTTVATQALHVVGNVLATGTITASNISVIGDFVTLNTVTSNTEQMVITNAGTGPALKVTQTGVQPIAEFYDQESGLAMTIANNGNVGIGTTNPLKKLDVIGDINYTGTLYQNGVAFSGGGSSQWTTSGNTIYYTSGNVGIGTTVPLQSLHVQSKNMFVGQNTSNQIYRVTNNITSPPSVDGFINGVSLTALNKRTRTSYAAANECVSTWTTRTTIDNGWISICWAPELSLFCAVALGPGSGNRVMTSPDGITWTTRSCTDKPWREICWAPELALFCVVSGNYTGGGAVMTSSNGINWTTRSSSTDYWNSICWSPELSIFCAVGAANRVMTSPNGITWTTRSSPSTDTFWENICWAPELSIFCAVSSQGTGNRVMTSPDGINWTSRTSPNNTYYCICWAPELSLFCVASYYGSGDCIMTSPDGINWTTRTAPNYGWISICWAPELSLFCAVTDNGYRMMTSPDGITWTTRSCPSPSWYSICWAPELSIFCAVAYTNGTNNRAMTSAIAMPNAKSVVKALPSQMMVDANGNVGIWTTVPTAPLHVRPNTSTTGVIIDQVGSGGILDVRDGGVSKMLVDANGNVGIGTTIPLQSLHVYSKDVWIGKNTQYANYAMYGSNLRTPMVDGRINGVSITALNNRTRTSYAAAKDCVSSWTTRTSSTTDVIWNSVCWAPELSLFCAVASYSLSGSIRVMTSPDGITWTSRSAVDNAWTSVCWAAELSLFCAVAAGGIGGAIGNRVMTSPNGITWTTRASAADNGWQSICWAPELSLFCAVANIIGTGNRVMTSPDGITWTTRAFAVDNEWQSICWAPELSLFCVVANGSGLGNRVMTSSNGITWTTRASAADNAWTSVCWAPELSLFCAVSETGTNNRVMTSPDGITWTTRVSAANNGWKSVCWAPELSLFCATATLTGTGNRVMTSPDGITWTTRSAIDNDWSSICWAPELSIFCAVSQNGTNNQVMTSAIGMPNAKSVVKALPSQIMVDANGNVGIGTTNPQTALQVSGIVTASTFSGVGQGFSSMEVITSGTSWTIPANVYRIKVTLIGGGGGGGGAAGNNATTYGSAGGGGGAGAVCVGYYNVTPAQILSYSIGTAGTASTASGTSNGGNGGNTTTTYNSITYTANGGSGGVGSAGNIDAVAAGGTASGGTLNLSGQYGGKGLPSNVIVGLVYPVGGCTALGFGIGGIGMRNTDNISSNGYGYGGGGAGGITVSSGVSARAGGAGAPGALIIEY